MDHRGKVLRHTSEIQDVLGESTPTGSRVNELAVPWRFYRVRCYYTAICFLPLWTQITIASARSSSIICFPHIKILPFDSLPSVHGIVAAGYGGAVAHIVLANARICHDVDVGQG